MTEIVSTFEVDEIWGKIYKLEAGMLVPQHEHEHDHVTMLIEGKFKAWVEDKALGVFSAPYALTIKANARHTFETLEPCIFCCLHNLRGTGLSEPSVLRKYALGDIPLE